MHAGDSLLYVLSVRVEIDCAQFKAYVSTLTSNSDAEGSSSGTVSRIVRLLDALGHVEMLHDNDELRLCVCNPTLIRLPTQRVRAVLAGSRGVKLVDDLRVLASQRGLAFSMRPHNSSMGHLLPQVISFECEQDEVMREFAESADLVYSTDPPCARMAQFSSNLEQVASRWTWSASTTLDWPATYFSIERAYFNNTPDLAAIRLVKYLSPINNRPRFWAWEGDRHADVDVDWGRYWVLNRTSTDLMLFDVQACQLYHPQTIPLPKLLARTAMLCSGEAPLVSFERTPKYVYTGVPEVIAEIIASKLGQNLYKFNRTRK
jgi:hypothetical protein